MSAFDSKQTLLKSPDKHFSLGRSWIYMEPSINNLNKEHLIEAKNDAIIKGISEKGISFQIATEIIFHSMGRSFLRDLCVKTDRLQDANILKIETFADLLWRLRRAQNFYDYIEGAKKRVDLESIYYELFIANLILSSCENVKFINPEGSRGKDYDLEGINFNGTNESIIIEVKARRKTFENIKSFKTFLNNYRTQFPKNSGGILVVKIKEALTLPNTYNKINTHEIEDTIKSFIKGTKRVSRVIYLWKIEGKNEKEQFEMYFVKCINNKGEHEQIFHFNRGNIPSYMIDIQ